MRLFRQFQGEIRLSPAPIDVGGRGAAEHTWAALKGSKDNAYGKQIRLWAGCSTV